MQCWIHACCVLYARIVGVSNECFCLQQRKPPSERQNERYVWTREFRETMFIYFVTRSSGWKWGMDRRRLDPMKVGVRVCLCA